MKEPEHDSFFGWKIRGRFVRKGERHRFRRADDNAPLFHISQTDEKYPSLNLCNEHHSRQYHTDEPEDRGKPVYDNAGRQIGIRGYTKFNDDEWVPVTHYPDGSSNVHCGGPCGDLYVDEFGNT